MSTLWILVLLAIAFAIVIVSYAVTYPSVGAKLTDRMGAGDWKFTESWASTLTALGSILTAVLAAQVLPSDTEAQKLVKGTYVVYSLMFATVIVVGTGVYNTLRKQNRGVAQPAGGTPKAGETPRVGLPENDAPQTSIQYQGFVIFFLIACGLVLWAVLGQLLTAWYLLGEVPNLSASIYSVFQVLLAVAAFLALLYVAISVPWTLRNQAYHDEIGTSSNTKQKDRVRASFYWP
jgi:hypothetical protein